MLAQKKRARSSRPNRKIILAIMSVRDRLSPPPAHGFPALAMSGGYPYICALPRAISAGESNTANPHTALYGGGNFHDFTRHPDRCISIVTEPNLGKCTTAAGRYRYLTSTWLEKARRYHPRNTTYPYSFTPEDQDRVTYAWLKDSRTWGQDIPSLLRQRKSIGFYEHYHRLGLA
jgi:muramidase (phage lysozyme)